MVAHARHSVNVGGATVTLTLSGSAEYRGLLILAEARAHAAVGGGPGLSRGRSRAPPSLAAHPWASGVPPCPRACSRTRTASTR